jgi:ribulose 1,5-bisphosphate synthetase/thiazole synthase
MTKDQELHVAIVGGGPAGLFAAQKLSSAGYGVALFNRDIKPGGLVEYGIFLEKHKIKNGFRNQFRQFWMTSAYDIMATSAWEERVNLNSRPCLAGVLMP